MMRAALCLLAFSFLALPSVARAQAPSTMSYQGVLTDASGQIVTDGPYDLTFRIYDIASGGAPLWAEAHPGVVVERGGFSVVLGATNPLSLIFDRRYWMSVQVFADPELAPRVELASSPYALSLRLPFSQTLPSAAPLLTLDNTDAAAPDAVFKGRLDVGTSASSGDLRLFRSAGVGTSGRLYASTHGANLDLFEEGGGVHAFLQADANGEGGFLTVFRDYPVAGFQVDGNASGTLEPTVSILGSTRSCSFNMGQAGNGSVGLPADAISAGEMLDEAGMAADLGENAISLTSSVLAIQSKVITCPTSGYVVVIGTAQTTGTHTNGTTSSATFGVSDGLFSFPATQDLSLNIPAALPSTSYSRVVTVHGTFPVTAGSNTFLLLAEENGGSWVVTDRQLTVMFFPTAYGTVGPNEPAATTGAREDLEEAATGRGLTSADLARAREEARAFHAARLQRELDEMRTRLAEVERQVRQAAAEQASGTAAAGPR